MADSTSLTRIITEAYHCRICRTDLRGDGVTVQMRDIGDHLNVAVFLHRIHWNPEALSQWIEDTIIHPPDSAWSTRFRSLSDVSREESRSRAGSELSLDSFTGPMGMLQGSYTSANLGLAARPDCSGSGTTHIFLLTIPDSAHRRSSISAYISKFFIRAKRILWCTYWI